MKSLFVALALVASIAAAQNRAVPRMPDGKPNFQGIWQAVTSANAGLEDHVAGNGMVAGRSVVVGGTIPYKPEAAAQRAENFKNRVQADPYRKCFLPGTPRIMYLDYPFQIFQTRDTVGMTFEWQLVYRLIHTDNRPHPEDYDSWMGDSRGHRSEEPRLNSSHT